MCRKVSCKQCGKATWAGCGQHVDQVLGSVPEADRCQCDSGPASAEGRGGAGSGQSWLRRILASVRN